MSFEFDRGLFQFDFTDRNAILGVPIDAEFNDVRKRYLKIASRLHPDTCPFEKEADKELANQLFSKLVSPAYNKFSKEEDRAEYLVILAKLKQRVDAEKNNIQLSNETAKKIQTAGDYQEVYKSAIAELAKDQYETLERTLEIIGELSELNLAYLQRQKSKTSSAGSTLPTPPPSPSPAAKKPPAGGAKTSPPARPTPTNALVEQACDRAQSLIASKNLPKAIFELKGALKQDPDRSRIHALLALCYLQQNQGTMAKIELKKALTLDPKDPKALEVKKQLEKLASKGGDKKGTSSKKDAEKKGANTKADKGGGGFLGGLFGGGGGKKK